MKDKRTFTPQAYGLSDPPPQPQLLAVKMSASNILDMSNRCATTYTISRDGLTATGDIDAAIRSMESCGDSGYLPLLRRIRHLERIATKPSE